MKNHPWLALLVGLIASALHAEEMAVVKEPNVNVRGQASLIGEVVTQLKQGEKVVVLEEITVAKPKKDEPAKWAKIQMPSNTPVWVSALFIDQQNKTVKPPRLNLRGGPGENFSVVGRLQRGDVVKSIRTVEDWMEIEAPTSAYGFVAAHLLGPVPVPAPAPVPPPVTAPAIVKVEKPEPSPVPSSSAPEPAPVTEKTVQPEPAAPVAATPASAKPESALASTPTPPQNVLVVPTVPTSPAVEAEPLVASPSETPVAAEPPPRRVVRREGVVHGTVSIQAPAYYELVGPDSNRVINYLHLNEAILLKLETTVRGFKDYVGRSVVVIGEEFIDPRWPRTPVIEVETLKLVF